MDSENLLSRLKSMINGLPENIRRCQLVTELDLLLNMKLFDKITTSYELVSALRKSNIIHQFSSSAATGSLLCYTLNLTPADPLELEFVFELMLAGTEFLPMHFTIGIEQQDRLISILKRRYNAAITRPAWPLRPEVAPIEVIFPLTGDGDDHFLSTAAINRILPVSPAVLHKNRFVFYPSRLYDIIKKCEILLDKSGIAGSLPTVNSVQLDERKPVWNLSAHMKQLDLEHRWGWLELLETFQTVSSTDSLIITALYFQKSTVKEAKISIHNFFNEQRKWTPEEGYHCLSILEDTGGKLIFKEQFCNLLYFLGKYTKLEAVAELLKGESDYSNWYSHFIEDFTKKCSVNNISSITAQKIAVETAQRVPILISKEQAYNQLLPVAILQNYRNLYSSHFKNALNL